MKTKKPNFKNIEPDFDEFLDDISYLFGKWSLQKLAKATGVNRETLRLRAKKKL